MEIKVSENGVYKVIPKEDYTSERLWSILSEVIPAKDQIFAAFSTSPGKYVWTLPGDGWVCLADADESTASLVQETLDAKKRAVIRALTDHSGLRVDALFVVPSEEYVFFRPASDGSLQVMLVAWDYKFPARPEGGPVIITGSPHLKRQDVCVKFIEAEKPVPGYHFLLKLIDGRLTEKTADPAGRFQMAGLVIGKSYQLYSADRSRDFTFTVQAGKSEVIIDLTGDIIVEVAVNRDDAPAQGVPVKISFVGMEYSPVTGEDGIARQAVPYRKDADVIVRVEDKMETVSAVYPLTKIDFDLFTPVASIIVDFFRNEKPVPSLSVFVRIPGSDSLVLNTNAAGRATCRVPFRRETEIVVEVGSFSDHKPFEMETYFRFDERVPVRFDPAIRVKNTDGDLEKAYPVIVELEGRRDEYRTDDTGLVDLRSVLAGAEMIVRDGKNPDNVRSFVLNEDQLVYELIVPAPVIEMYHVALVPQRGKTLPEGLELTLKQGTHEFPLAKGDDGRFHIKKDDLVAGSTVEAIILKDGAEFGRVDVVFVRDEDDYEIVVNQKKKVAVGPLLARILVALLAAGLLAGGLYAFLFFLF